MSDTKDVLTDRAEVPQSDPHAKAGYTFDPYSDPCQLADIHSPNIPFHNYRQIHVSEIAYGAGFRATSVKEIPECPPLWQDVGHYWNAAALAGYFTFEFGTKDSLVIKAGTVIGSAGLFELVKHYVLPALGMG
jgi:hypothetical protein